MNTGVKALMSAYPVHIHVTMSVIAKITVMKLLIVSGKMRVKISQIKQKIV